MRMRFLLTSIIILLSSSCAIDVAATNPLKEKVSIDEGTVVLSVTANTGEVNAFDRIFVKPAYDSPAAAKLFSLKFWLVNALPSLSRDTSLFIGALPPGDYELESFYDDSTRKYLVLTDANSYLIGSFRVEAGHTVDLGRVVLTAVNAHVTVGRSATLLSNRTLVDRFIPSSKSIYLTPALPGWNRPPTEADVAEQIALRHPQGATGLSELKSGHVIAATRMGTIIKRGKDGRWKIFSRTGTLNGMLWTVPYETGDNVAVAAGELNSLIKITKDGKSKPVTTGDLPDGNLVFIDHSPDTRVWLVGLQAGDQVSLYKSATLENGHWEKLRSDLAGFSPWIGLRSVWFWTTPSGIGFASSKSRKFACYSYRENRWTEHGSPADRVPIGLSASAAGIGTLTSPGGGFAGIFTRADYSRDCGKTWTETHSPYSVKVAAPLVLPSGTILESGGVFGDKGLYASKDSGKTWRKASAEASFGESVWVLPTAGLISISQGQFGIELIRRSANEGQNWTLELSSIDRQLLEADRQP